MQNKFIQLKCRTKKKASNILSELRKSDSGINESNSLIELGMWANSLSNLDKKIIRLIGATSLTGIKGGLGTSESINETRK